MNGESINKVWSDYFERVIDEENPRVELRTCKPNWGMIDCIQEEEIAEAFRKMKKKKAPGWIQYQWIC